MCLRCFFIYIFFFGAVRSTRAMCYFYQFIVMFDSPWWSYSIMNDVFADKYLFQSVCEIFAMCAFRLAWVCVVCVCFFLLPWQVWIKKETVIHLFVHITNVWAANTHSASRWYEVQLMMPRLESQCAYVRCSNRRDRVAQNAQQTVVCTQIAKFVTHGINYIWCTHL